jgi:proline dehydrogenase
MVSPFVRAIPQDLVRFFARPYVAGDSLEKAIDTAADLLVERGIHTTLDLLAEGIDSQAVVEQNIFTYFEMINAAAADDRFRTAAERPTVSLKPSSYTTVPLEKGGDARGSREAVWRIAEHARARGVQITVDMESSHWTDYTLTLLNELHAAGHTEVGTVVQTRLHRSEKDLDRLPPGCRVRLVIGIYREPAAIALVEKRGMKDRLLQFAEILLRRGHYVEFATHDEEYLHRFVNETVAKTGAARDRFELQMLYGVPRRGLQDEMIRRGIKMRLYVPFALGWPMAIAYLRRRLDEYPAMMALVLGDVFHRQRGRG